MARVNIYLPEELAAAVKEADLNVSAIAQAALTEALADQELDRWLEEMRSLPRIDVPLDEVLEAVHEAREEFGRWPR
jgi:post-segregation antitoxin (ccd killing protein)